ncbi:PEGA domain-containing protein [Pseudoalteromonas sp. SWXJZ94C]|jgi:hypothetical protein|uniref:PEGA domain-containing protein n=1 Tax=Pseudoalteromonas sp. SWXJZ94C TaxID=2792065 RepID=UPI0018CD3E47|nr:PEGA domain-containing protein [Pseudoalteromonas sp. SWXJZ94C]MBH0058435.1 PEGA domain-containing protein [Pseudoalteromonas sp. SWXJZ94C]
MKRLSSIVAILLLSGCSTTSSVEKQQPVEEPVAAESAAETSEANAPISLTVITTPADARVRIMNIAPVYKAAIELDAGKYDVEVSKKGYDTYRKWISVDKKTILTIQLTKKEESQAAQ